MRLTFQAQILRQANKRSKGTLATPLLVEGPTKNTKNGPRMNLVGLNCLQNGRGPIPKFLQINH